MRFIAVLLVSPALVTTLAAQQPPPPAPARDSAVALPDVTTTATRSATPILQTPMAVSKVTASTLRSTSGHGVEDALRTVPGVIAQSRYGTSDVRLVIRGYGSRGAGDRSNSGTSRGVRVLLDGFPETEPDGRTAFDHVDLATAEAVEVIRSSASSLWGNAAGGVVNILSAPTPTRASVELQPIHGDFGLRRLAVRASAPLGQGAAWLSLSNSSFEGWRRHSDARRFVANAGARGMVSARTELGVYVVAANNLMHIPGPLTLDEYNADPAQANAAYLAREERRYNRQGRIGLSAAHQFGDAVSVSSLLYVNPRYLQRSERGTYRDFTRYHVGGNVVARVDADIGATTHRFSLGFDEAYQDGSIQFYALAPGSTRGALVDNKGEGAQNIGVFLQDELGITDRLSLLLGARWDRVAYTYRTFFDPDAVVKQQSKRFARVIPKLGVNWMLGKRQSVYANVGGGIEVPAGNETDQPPTGPVPGALLNPLLDAITSTTYEVGTKGLGLPVLGNGLLLGYDMALYATAVTNEIIPYSGGRYYQTAASARRRGVELGLTAFTRMGQFANAALTFNDHTYQRYVIDSSVISPTFTGTIDASGNEVMGVPTFMANVEVGSEVPALRPLRVKAALEHSGRYWADDRNTVAVPSFTIFDAGLELREPIVARNRVSVRAFMTVKNVTNRKHVGSAFLNPDPGPGGQPAVYEPGAPRSLLVSFSVGL